MFNTITLLLLTLMVINFERQFTTFSYELVRELLTTISIPYNSFVRHFLLYPQTNVLSSFYIS